MTIRFEQGNAPMPKDCICSPMDYAALGHMTACPCFAEVFIATPEFRDHAGLPGGTFDYPKRYRK